jgi:hypothetical protein
MRELKAVESEARAKGYLLIAGLARKQLGPA